MRYRFKYSSESIEGMLPWELDIELNMIAEKVQKENDRIQAMNSQ